MKLSGNEIDSFQIREFGLCKLIKFQFCEGKYKYRHSNKLLLCLYIGTYLYEVFEDTNGVIRIRKSKKNRQHNDQMKMDKQRSTKHYT